VIGVEEVILGVVEVILGVGEAPQSGARMGLLLPRLAKVLLCRLQARVARVVKMDNLGVD